MVLLFMKLRVKLRRERCRIGRLSAKTNGVADPLKGGVRGCANAQADASADDVIGGVQGRHGEIVRHYRDESH